MRILLTADTLGGVWTYAVELIRALQPLGVDVALATMGRPVSSSQHEEARGLSNLHLYESRFKLEWMEEPWADVAEAGEWLLQVEDDFRPDVIHLNGYVHGALPWRAPVLIVAHSCVLSWWEAVKGEPAPASWARYAEEVRRGIRGANLLAAPTAAMLAEIRKLYGPLRNTRVISNGRHPGAFHRARKGPIIFAAGRLWDEAKNLSALEAAADGVNWEVCVAGDSRHPNGRVVQQCSTRALGFLPAAELREWLARAAIYALPARYEPFGLSALEAALSGCALVLGDIPSLREVWGETALYVAPDDPAALRSVLNVLAGDAALRNRLAEAAHRRALTYSASRMAEGYLQAYRHLLAAKSPSAREAAACAW